MLMNKLANEEIRVTVFCTQFLDLQMQMTNWNKYTKW